MTLLLFVRTEVRRLYHADEPHNLRAKQLSMAAPARVLWLYACVRYWPGRGLVYVCGCAPCFILKSLPWSCNNIKIIIIYSIYRALIPNGPKALYIKKKINFDDQGTPNSLIWVCCHWWVPVVTLVTQHVFLQFLGRIPAELLWRSRGIKQPRTHAIKGVWLLEFWAPMFDGLLPISCAFSFEYFGRRC